ncbi:asparagine synthase (glutamine-hydrolyzing) [Defluviitalea raffinosedens]|jgi:asparagine synthase (glutamine-hydrolysing)|uniref:asparagine synthase (glutamine-hydrolyzing) n=1 Tax=Defluviitalea raffinosedens TaxID=1450156 RepID=UPI00195DC3D2|nr:asparagine synthase (glutamine-hydrolyzing) [Defluviitalea raffinosedens]MBM7685023.1 asparagine synthase (glutamine-hydrolyzing) [Defluviitalea raffinosedens]MBZ4666905.1 asparagine synthase (glutamine-hydrolyzing) [Defluviitaleaceae bacterium]
MCGFCGFVGETKDREPVLKEMMNTIIHRGPDSDGQYIDDQAALGFRRLSIIDLAEGSQPLYNEEGNLVLVFNGEIYNYQSIRKILEEKGHIFKTHTDSEVLIHAYEEYQTDMLNHLRGMFAFVIWDNKNKVLFGARDFFGIKPFYYYNENGVFVFGSEIKSILKHDLVKKELNLNALETYLTFQYSAMEETFFKNIFRLPPAHFFIYKNGKMDIKRYWEPVFDAEDKSLEEYVEEIDQRMKESIKTHKISDVEVGSFLSSGVDSSYVAACFKGDKTFTVGFDYDQYNEIDYAKSLSEKVGIANYHKLITTKEYWEVLPKVQYYMDEPLADPSAVALYFVSQLASQHVKVVLSGEGADELFGGYNIYKEPLDLRVLTVLPKPVRKLLGKLASLLPFDIKGKNFFIRGSKSIEERFIGNAFMFTEKERKELLKHKTNAPSPFSLVKPYYDKVKLKDDVTKMQYVDIHMWLWGDILLKADKMSMAHSLELRVPFLDKEVFNLASRIPVKYRVNKHNTKYALRLAAKKNMPEDVANKKKLGFPVPIRIWLREEKYYNIVKEAFTSNAAQTYFNTDKLLTILDDHYKGVKDNSRKIWTIFMFLVWYKQYFEV